MEYSIMIVAKKRELLTVDLGENISMYFID